MGAGKGVVHVKVGIGGKGCGETGIIGLLTGVEAHILQQDEATGLQAIHGFFGFLADTIGSKNHRRVSKCLTQGPSQGSQRHFRHRLSPGPPEM